MDENMNEKKRLKRRTNNKLNPIMRQSLGCQPRQEDIRMHKVGEYKTRFKGYQ